MKSKMPLVYAALAAGLSALGVAHAGPHHHPHSPSDTAIIESEITAGLMTNTVIAALLQEIDETTPDNAPHGSLSISLIFNDKNKDMRLVGAMAPLRDNDYPEDDFEADALESALAGVPFTRIERVKGKWYNRRSIPLSNFAPECAMCHSNFVGLPADEYVGALMLRVPIEDD